MKTAVIVFPGSNCDRDLAVALEAVTGVKPAMVWHGDSELPEGLGLIGVPGGFSYGDYLRCGAIAARSPIMRAVVDAPVVCRRNDTATFLSASFAQTVAYSPYCTLVALSSTAIPGTLGPTVSMCHTPLLRTRFLSRTCETSLAAPAKHEAHFRSGSDAAEWVH